MSQLRLVLLILVAFVASNAGTFRGAEAVETPDGLGEMVPSYGRVAAPAPMLRPDAAPAVRAAGSTITVTYHDFPAEAKAAFEYAVTVWESYLVTKSEILVDASWVRGAPDGYLGRSSSGSFVKDNADDAALPIAEVIYPAALANAIRGRRVDQKPDIFIEINSAMPWYTGVDMRTPVDKFDLVTLALHEIGQQLGVRSGITLIAGVPVARSSSGLLTIYDRFVRTQDGQQVSSMFARSDPRLVAELTGGQLYFSGPATLIAGRGKPVKLYAPPVFNTGSSVSHLDDTTYDVPNDNALMTPFGQRGWPVHDPGPIVLAMLKDVGWTLAHQGVPVRLVLEPTSSLVWSGRPFNVQPVVLVADSVGAAVTSDNSTNIEVRPFSLYKNFAEGACAGQSQTVSSGKTAFHGCAMTGWSWAVVVARSPGLVGGFGNVFVVLGENRAFLPAVASP